MIRHGGSAAARFMVFSLMLAATVAGGAQPPPPTQLGPVVVTPQDPYNDRGLRRTVQGLACLGCDRPAPSASPLPFWLQAISWALLPATPPEPTVPQRLQAEIRHDNQRAAKLP